jgi:DNA-binding response OmpR family regulator
MRPPVILLVESDAAQATRTLDALRDVRLGDAVQMVEDVEDAALFLQRRPPYHYVSRPDIVLLGVDVRLPGAQELLDMLSRDPALVDVAVIALAPRRELDEIAEVCNGFADACIAKPVRAAELARCIRSLDRRRLHRFAVPQRPAVTNGV